MISPLSVIQIIADRDAQIAQLVEQRTENPRVVGSIPTLGTDRVTERSSRRCSSMVEH